MLSLGIDMLLLNQGSHVDSRKSVCDHCKSKGNPPPRGGTSHHITDSHAQVPWGQTKGTHLRLQLQSEKEPTRGHSTSFLYFPLFRDALLVSENFRGCQCAELQIFAHTHTLLNRGATVSLEGQPFSLPSAATVAFSLLPKCIILLHHSITLSERQEMIW